MSGNAARPNYFGISCIYVCVCVCDRAAIVFVVQHLFDEAQIVADNVGPPVTREQWQYLYRLGLDVRNSLSNVSSVSKVAATESAGTENAIRKKLQERKKQE